MVFLVSYSEQQYQCRQISRAPPRNGTPMFFVYVIKSLKEERIYVGHTQDIEVRLKYHNSGYVKSTAKDRPWMLIALKEVRDRNEARWIERGLKKSRGKRIKWIEQNNIKTVGYAPEGRASTTA